MDQWFQRRQYRCSTCDQAIFKSRSDWLVHLVMSPHSFKVLNSFEQWQTGKKGELYVISGLSRVENSMLLEYISDNLATFSDIVFFKPKANICIIVGDARELEAFTSNQHRVGGVPLKFKAYSHIDSTEWKSYFQEVTEESQDQGQINNASAPPPVNNRDSLKRKLDETAQCGGSTKAPKLSHNASPNIPTPQSAPVGQHGVSQLPVNSQPSGGRGYQSASFFIDKNRANWEEEMDKIQNYIFMPNEQIECRKNIITHLTDIFRRAHPQCKVVPVGADILGFNLDLTAFTIYFDSKGFTEAENAQLYDFRSKSRRG